MKKTKLILICLLLTLTKSPIFAKYTFLNPGPFDPPLEAGKLQSGRELYVAVLEITQNSNEFKLYELDYSAKTATVEYYCDIPGRRIWKVNLSIENNDILIVEVPNERKNSETDIWEKTGDRQLEKNSNGEFFPVNNRLQKEIGGKFMKIFSGNYNYIEKKINSEQRTWKYVFNTCRSGQEKIDFVEKHNLATNLEIWEYIFTSFKNEQELAEFFKKYDLLSNPITWRYVFRRCDNDLRFERFLMKYNILENEQTIPCTFIKVEMTSATQKAQYGNKKYVATFGYSGGKIFVYSNDGKFIDYDNGDKTNLKVVISSCEYQSITSDSVASVSDNENWRGWPDERGNIAIDLIVIE